ncbi:DUF748 domain-containing protein [Polaromonas sp. YR568]|uniref:DUF748 domain-containing protein n=1 Tax=Polaromonas sp. YR568 TaxID=1855301 RepID=UPI003137B6CA
MPQLDTAFLVTRLRTADWRAAARNLPSQALAVTRSSLWRRRAAWALGSLVLLWAVAWAAVPPLVKSQIEKIASEKLGRQVTLGAVDFKPWSLEITLTDLAILKAPGAAGANAASQMKIKRIYIDGELQSLLRLAPVVDAIEVDAPVVFLSRLAEGRYDIDDVLTRLAASPSEPAAKTPRFALYNLVIRGGELDFADLPVAKTHTVRELNLSLPFLSNLPSQREVKTNPHLAFKLNGSSFDTAAVGTPFAQTRKTDATLNLVGFDLSPYLGYWPAGLPVRLQSAVVNAEVKVAFEQSPGTVVRISGTVTANQVRILDTLPAEGSSAPASQGAPVMGNTVANHDLLRFERLHIVMGDVRPLEQVVKLSAVELSQPVIELRRNRAGQLNVLPPSKSAPPAPGQTATRPWRVEMARMSVEGGQIHWRDESLAAPATIRLADVALNASALAYPFAANAPLQFDGSASLAPPAQEPGDKASSRPGGTTARKAKAPAEAHPAQPARLSFRGTATDQVAQATATLAAWPLNMAAKYVGQFLLPALNGQLDAELAVNWQAARGDQAQRLQIMAPQIAVGDVQLAEGRTSVVSVKRVELTQAEVDVTGKTFKAASLQLTQPRALVDRGTDKRWMYERWLVTPTKSPTGRGVAGTPADTPVIAPPPKTTEATRATAPSWAVAINDVQLQGGAMSFADKSGVKPVAFEVSGVQARLGALVLDDRPGQQAQAAKPMPLAASLRLATGRFEPGRVDFNGTVGLLPIQAQGRLTADRLPVQAFEPYFADAVNIELLRADASFKGRVSYRQTPKGPQARLAGNVALEEFQANTLAPSEDLLAWKALNLRGVDVTVEPARATVVEVKETVITDFFARVIVLPDGRINLQDLVRKPATPPVVTPVATSPVPVSTARAAAPAPAASSGLEPVIRFGPMSLINGKVLFSDRFVKPNYSADLSDLTGKLSAFSSVPATPATGTGPAAPEMADLELRGRAEGTASLEILGKLNPLATPLALDIKGKVRDLELPPLSPYSVKYAGYGINRGKLSVDVSYLIKPDGQLTATNKVILNQLAFGDKVEGAPGSLPVKLAVALLADRNGVIDIDLPISGSLNDPQFSLGPIIIKVIINVIVKAITAPFSLLASAFGGGGDELSIVSFAAGSAQLSAEAKAGLDKVAKALLDRPSLQLTVVGISSVEVEREGFKRERLDALVRAEKRRSTVKEGGTTSATVTVSVDEYPALLKEVYKRADMPKPRNLIGLAKDLPVPEMEKLLMASITVNDDAMRELAVQRGVAVKDYLASRELPPARLFLGAAKAVPPEAKWTPRAELNLAMP